MILYRKFKLSELVFFSLVFFLIGCSGAEIKNSELSEEGWNYSPDVIRSGNSGSKIEKIFYYKKYAVAYDSKIKQESAQVELECSEKAKKENSDDLISDMVSSIVEPSPVIKHKPMTGALMIAKYSNLIPKVSILGCSQNTGKSNCNCLLTLEVAGGKEEIYNQAKEIDSRKPSQK